VAGLKDQQTLPPLLSQALNLDRLWQSLRLSFSPALRRTHQKTLWCGERPSAALLDGALITAGIASRLIGPREVSLSIEGDTLNAELISIDSKRVLAWFDEFSILVLPGFFGIDAVGRVGLLGRGGSDYSALFLAHALNAQSRLIKDVPVFMMRIRPSHVLRRIASNTSAGTWQLRWPASWCNRRHSNLRT
jgi:aspartokinase